MFATKGAIVARTIVLGFHMTSQPCSALFRNTTISTLVLTIWSALEIAEDLSFDLNCICNDNLETTFYMAGQQDLLD